MSVRKRSPAPSDPLRHDRRIIAMKLPQTGGCLCGKIGYEITEAPQLVYTCPCVDCQRLQNSVFSMGIVVHDTAFHFIGVEQRQLIHTDDNVRVTSRLVWPG